MKGWYLTREGINGFHKSVKLAANKKVLLDEEQAALYNKHKEFLVETEPPTSIDECAIASDYDSIPKDEEDSRKISKDKSRSAENAS